MNKITSKSVIVATLLSVTAMFSAGVVNAAPLEVNAPASNAAVATATDVSDVKRVAAKKAPAKKAAPKKGISKGDKKKADPVTKGNK